LSPSSARPSPSTTRFFCGQAQQITIDPGHPTAFDIRLDGKPAPLRMSEIMVSGPTMAYLLVPTIWAHGAEWVAHATQLLLLIAAILGTVTLGFRLGATDRDATIAALLLAATPASLAMASSAMPDIAAMAFGVIGLERLLAWRETRRWPAGLAATGALAAGALARSHVLLLLPVGVALLLWTPATAGRTKAAARPTGRLWIPVALVPIVVAAVSFLLQDPDGAASVIGATMRYSGTEQVAANLAAFATHWALALPLALCLDAAPRSRAWCASRRCISPASRSARSSGILSTSARVVDRGGRRAERRRAGRCTDRRVASPRSRSARAGSRALRSRSGWAVSAPALQIPAGLSARCGPATGANGGPTRAARGVANGRRHGRGRPVLAVLIIRADAAFADLGRRAADDLIATRTARGQTVWFAGHWGFQWYAERAGAKPLTLHGPAPRPGDLAVSSQNALGAIIEVFQPRTLVTVLASDQPGGRIMSRAAGAGFYSNVWGYLPWPGATTCSIATRCGGWMKRSLSSETGPFHSRGRIRSELSAIPNS
jgi:hypothetical protein